MGGDVEAVGRREGLALHTVCVTKILFENDPTLVRNHNAVTSNRNQVSCERLTKMEH